MDIVYIYLYMKDNTNKLKRIVIHKPNLKNCEICKKDISLYSFASHIKWTHKLTSDEYVKLYGEFRQIRTKNPSGRKIKKIICQLCNVEFSSVGLFTHLRDTHNITTDEYALKFGEYRPSNLREIEYKERLNVIADCDKQQCIICNQFFASGILLGYHIKNIHGITKKQYINKYIFEGIHPKCKCGCGRNVKVLNRYPYKVDYVSGHNKGTLGFKFSQESRLKMSKSAIDRINRGVGKTTDTKPELRFKFILDKFNILYEHPYEVNLENRIASVDFYLPEKDLLVEIDGEYWHPNKLETLNFHTLPNVISDKQREYIRNIVHLRENDLEFMLPKL